MLQTQVLRIRQVNEPCIVSGTVHTRVEVHRMDLEMSGLVE